MVFGGVRVARLLSILYGVFLGGGALPCVLYAPCYAAIVSRLSIQTLFPKVYLQLHQTYFVYDWSIQCRSHF